MDVLRTGRVLGWAAAVLLASIVGTACGSGSDDAKPTRDAARAVAGWPLPNADRDNTRSSTSKIDASNVDDLGVAWHQELNAVDAERGIDSTPLVVDDAIYVQDADSNVWAYDLERGDELWRRKLRTPAVGPNGVSYENGRVFAATPTDAVALDADNGGVQWRTRVIEGPVGPRRDSAGISMAPMVADGQLLLGDAGARSGGVLASFDTKDGTEQWRVTTSIDGARDAVQTGGMLGTPLVSSDGTVVVGVNGARGNRSADPLPGALRAVAGDSGTPVWNYEPRPLQQIARPGPEPISGTLTAGRTLDLPDAQIDITTSPARCRATSGANSGARRPLTSLTMCAPAASTASTTGGLYVSTEITTSGWSATIDVTSGSTRSISSAGSTSATLVMPD